MNGGRTVWRTCQMRRNGRKRLSERGKSAGAAADDPLAASFPLPGFPIGRTVKGPRAVAERLPLVSGDDRYRRRDFESLPEPPEESRAWDDFVPQPMILAPQRPPHDLRRRRHRPPDLPRPRDRQRARPRLRRRLPPALPAPRSRRP